MPRSRLPLSFASAVLTALTREGVGVGSGSGVVSEVVFGWLGVFEAESGKRPCVHRDCGPHNMRTH